MEFGRPTRAEVLAAAGKVVPDIIAPNLKVLFCGVNPGLYSGATGHHFAYPGNRFWKALYQAGFTARLFSPFEESKLLTFGYGIVNLVARATASEAALTKKELVAGGKTLVQKVRRFKPESVAILGIGAYQMAFFTPKAKVGPQEKLINHTRIWVLPNPSGLNANYLLPDLVEEMKKLRLVAETK
ncbi:MAG TPA: G/U mismatch-specific DNA glycosylase [Patescibacteria group bacterium]|nr:G/U mismatch-specific DNA glycosylase [Patescibacteria group bacterium]